MDIATGRITAHCGDTRTEADFAHFIDSLLQQNPEFKRYENCWR